MAITRPEGSHRFSSAPPDPVILFVALAGGLGGSTRSLATVMSHLEGDVRRALASRPGSFRSFVRGRSLAEAYVALPGLGSRPLRRLSRVPAALRIAMWTWGHRKQLLAIHANGPEELSVVAPAALITGVPVVVWCHAREPSPWNRRLGPLWRRLLRRVRWAAVSPTAARVLIRSGLADPDDVSIIPDPIDPDDVLAEAPPARSDVVIGYLGSSARYKGFHLLPDVVEMLRDAPARWVVFSDGSTQQDPAIWRRLRAVPEDRLRIVGKVTDVRQAYAACDIVFCPSLEESFGRVAAEAMLNGRPVVASDLEPLRNLLGEEEAGLLFPVGDAEAAAASLRRLIEDRDLRTRLGEGGRVRGKRLEPSVIVSDLSALYGLQDQVTTA